MGLFLKFASAEYFVKVDKLLDEVLRMLNAILFKFSTRR